MQEIVPGIFVETNYPPYNLGLITTDKGAVVVDVPPRPSHAWAWRHQVEERVGEPAYVVLTDASLERQIAAANWDVPIIASEATLRTITAYEERDWRNLIQDIAEHYPDEEEDVLALKPHPPKVAFSETFMLHHRTPPLTFEVTSGAAVGALWLHVPEHALVFAGDSVAIGVPLPLAHTPDSKAWLNVLGTLVYRATVQRIVPGRGKAVIDDEELEAAREFLRVMRRTARSLARKTGDVGLTTSAEELVQTFFSSMESAVVWEIEQGLIRLVEEIEEAEEEEEDADAA